MAVEQVAIIGAGPCGLAAAFQLKRYGLDPLILEMDEIGGLLRNANFVENYPGFPNGIAGLQLVKRFEEQARALALRITFERVEKLDRTGQAFQLQTQRTVYHAHAVLVASGTDPIHVPDLEIPGPLQNTVFYEVFPILNVTGKTIAIVGAGDAAFDYALNLSRSNRVLILNRSDAIKALPVLQQAVRASTQIEYRPNVSLSQIQPAPNGGMTLHCQLPDQRDKILVHLLLFAIGRTPRLDFLSDRLKKLQNPIENLYLGGDVKNDRYRQTGIAVGDGIRAAMTIYQKLREKRI